MGKKKATPKAKKTVKETPKAQPKQPKITKPAPKQGRGKLISNRDGREIKPDEIIAVTIKYHGDKNGGHHHVILGNIDDKHVSVGLSTKKSKGKGSKNYTLDTSPLQDGKKSYIRRQGQVNPIGEYKDKRKGIMTKADHERATVYGERARQKYINGKKDEKK